MEPIFQTMPGLSEGDIAAARSLLDLMLAGKRVEDHPLYKTFHLPESGLHFTPEWFLAKGGQTVLIWDKVSLITLVDASDGHAVAILASLQRVPESPPEIPPAAPLEPEMILEPTMAPPEVQPKPNDLGFWSTLVFWSMFLISWLVFALAALLKAIR